MMEWIKIFAGVEEAKQRVQPGKPQLLIVNGQRICLVFVDDTFLAVQDACSHNGESLSKGHINYLGEIICPWHNYRFDLKSGKASDSSSPDLKTYPVKVNETGFFIGI
jgi:nitrite reductase/ring-hydroxylating ferredoxin subunit